jgi:hypothetical protein
MFHPRHELLETFLSPDVLKKGVIFTEKGIVDKAVVNSVL